MQISGKALLNSAENILKERHKDNRAAAGSVAGSAPGRSAAADSLLNQSGLESRLLKLQARLSDIQRDYSLQQVRQTYLEKHADQIGPDLRFGEEPLFPEYKENMDLSGLRQKVGGQMEQLIRSLKSAQVEMENLYALNFEAPPRSDLSDAARLLEAGGLKQLDPARVAHLTRNSD